MRYLSLLLLTLTVATTASAQPYSTRGFALGAGLQYAGVSASENNFEADDAGGGLGVLAEYGFNETLSLFLGLGGAAIAEDVGLGQGDLGVKVHFSPGQRVRPFAMAAFSGVSVVNDDEDVTFSGGGVTLGGGVRYFFSRSVALDLQGGYSLGEFNEIEVGSQSQGDLNIDMNAYRVHFGVLFLL